MQPNSLAHAALHTAATAAALGTLQPGVVPSTTQARAIAHRAVAAVMPACASAATLGTLPLPGAAQPHFGAGALAAHAAMAALAASAVRVPASLRTPAQAAAAAWLPPPGPATAAWWQYVQMVHQLCRHAACAALAF